MKKIRRIKTRHFYNEDCLIEMRIVMFVMIVGGVIYFEIFNDQKLRKMIPNDNLVTKLNVLAKMLSIKLALLRCVGWRIYGNRKLEIILRTFSDAGWFTQCSRLIMKLHTKNISCFVLVSCAMWFQHVQWIYQGETKIADRHNNAKYVLT